MDVSAPPRLNLKLFILLYREYKVKYKGVIKAKHSMCTKGQGHIFTFKALHKRSKKMLQHTQVLAHTSRNFTWVQETYTSAFIIHDNWFLRLISNTQGIYK